MEHKFSFYNRCWSKDNCVVTLNDVQTMVSDSNGYPANNTRQYREAKSAGNEKQASDIKRNSFTFTPGAVISGARSGEKLLQLSGLAMVDIDHIPLDRLQEVLSKVRADKHTMFEYITISGEGIRVIFAYEDADAECLKQTSTESKEEFIKRANALYLRAWKAGNAYYSNLCGTEIDQSCKDCIRNSFLAGDAQCYIKLEAEKMNVEFGNVGSQELGISGGCADGMEALAHTPHATRLPEFQSSGIPGIQNNLGISGGCADGMEAQHAAGLPEIQNSRDSEIQPNPEIQNNPEERSVVAHNDDKAIQKIVFAHISRYKYDSGNRHNFWLLFGFALKRAGIQTDAIPYYIDKLKETLLLQNIVQNDDPMFRNSSEVEDAVAYGYEHGNTGSRNLGISGGYADGMGAQHAAELPEIDLSFPAFPEAIYNGLPHSIETMLKAVYGEDLHSTAISKHHRDSLLMSTLCQYSAMLTGCTINYGEDGSRHSVNMSFICISPPGNKKSDIANAFDLCKEIELYLEKKHGDDIKRWNELNEIWNIEKATAQKEGRKVNMELQPPLEPLAQMFAMASMTSKTTLVDMLNSMANRGIIINTSEIDALVKALKKEFGDFSDIIRQAISNEIISKFYKSDKIPTYIEFPRLSICMTGTMNQFHRFITDLEDGLFSRFMYIQIPRIQNFINQKPRKTGTSKKQLIEELSKDALDLWKLQDEGPTTVEFTDAQWTEHYEMWKESFESVKNEGEDLQLSIVARHAQYHIVLAAVLTRLHNWEQYKEARNASLQEDLRIQLQHTVCTDDDFHRAAEMMKCMMHHALTLSTTKMVIQPANTLPMTEFKWTDKALSHFSKRDSFTRTEFMEYVVRYCGRRRSTAYNAVKRLIENGKIKQEGDTLRVTTD